MTYIYFLFCRASDSLTDSESEGKSGGKSTKDDNGDVHKMDQDLNNHAQITGMLLFVSFLLERIHVLG